MGWKELRKDLVKTTFRKIITSLDEAPYYEPLRTQFAKLELTDVEQEIHCDESLRLLLMGFEADDIRLVWSQSDVSHVKPIGLQPNPSFDPRIRAYISSFDDVVSYLSVIYSIDHKIHKNYSQSRLARSVTRMIAEKTAELIDGILVKDPSEQSEYFDKCLLERQVNTIRKPLKCFANTVLSIYEGDLVGGQIIDLLNDRAEKSVLEEKNTYSKCKSEAWKVYLGILGNWMSYGELTDPCKDLFIWKTSEIPPVKVFELGKFLDDSISKESSEFIVIPDLCPKFLRHVLRQILRCGLHARELLSEQRTDNAKPLAWETMNEFEFIRNVTTTERGNAKAELQELRDSHQLFSFIDELHTVLTMKTIVPGIVRLLSQENLLRRNYKEVPKSLMDNLSLQLLSSKDYNTRSTIYDGAKLVKCEQSVFDDIRKEQKSQMSFSEDSETPLPHVLSLELCIPEALQKVFPRHIINCMLLTFRLHLILNVASFYEEESRIQLPKHGELALDRRLEYILLQKLGRHIFDIKRTLNISILNARLLYNEKLAEVKSVDQLVKLQWEFCSKILQDALKNDSSYLHIIEELVTLIDFFSQSIGNADMLAKVEEEYNTWLEAIEAYECQSSDI